MAPSTYRGTTAVLLGWRESTIDADILFVPEQDSLYRALPRLKEELHLNVEIASLAHFIPELPGWRSEPVDRARGQGLLFPRRAYSKSGRSNAETQRTGDAQLVVALADPQRLHELFEAIEPRLHRNPSANRPRDRSAPGRSRIVPWPGREGLDRDARLDFQA